MGVRVQTLAYRAYHACGGATAQPVFPRYPQPKGATVLHRRGCRTTGSRRGGTEIREIRMTKTIEVPPKHFDNKKLFFFIPLLS